MAKDGSEALGAPELAGTFVASKGNTSRLLVGGVTMAKLASGGGPDGMPEFGQAAYLAVGADEVVLVKNNTGLMSIKPKVGSEALARFARSDIASINYDRGMMKGTLSLTFANENVWEFEIPKAYAKSAKRVVEALGGTIG